MRLSSNRTTKLNRTLEDSGEEEEVTQRRCSTVPVPGT
jgi:hypothetical protein